jgi:hypothetical protein
MDFGSWRDISAKISGSWNYALQYIKTYETFVEATVSWNVKQSMSLHEFTFSFMVISKESLELHVSNLLLRWLIVYETSMQTN